MPPVLNVLRYPTIRAVLLKEMNDVVRSCVLEVISSISLVLGLRRFYSANFKKSAKRSRTFLSQYFFLLHYVIAL